VVGLNVGWGWARVEGAEQGASFITDHESALAGGLRLGWAKNEFLLYSLEFSGWDKNWDYYGTTNELTIFTGTVSLTWFPGGQGLFVRGGLGWGSLEVKFRTVPQFTVFKEASWAFTVGLGYEWRLGEDFAIGAAYDFRYLPIGDFEIFTNVKGYNSNVTVNLNWYL